MYDNYPTEKIAAAIAAARKKSGPYVINCDAIEKEKGNVSGSSIIRYPTAVAQVNAKSNLDSIHSRHARADVRSQPAGLKRKDFKLLPKMRHQIVPSAKDVTTKTIISNWDTLKQHRKPERKPMKAQICAPKAVSETFGPVIATEKRAKPSTGESIQEKKDVNTAASEGRSVTVDDTRAIKYKKTDESHSISSVKKQDPNSTTSSISSSYDQEALRASKLQAARLRISTPISETFNTLTVAFSQKSEKQSSRTKKCPMKPRPNVPNGVLMKKSDSGKTISTTKEKHVRNKHRKAALKFLTSSSNSKAERQYNSIAESSDSSIRIQEMQKRTIQAIQRSTKNSNNEKKNVWYTENDQNKESMPINRLHDRGELTESTTRNTTTKAKIVTGSNESADDRIKQIQLEMENNHQPPYHSHRESPDGCSETKRMHTEDKSSNMIGLDENEDRYNKSHVSQNQIAQISKMPKSETKSAKNERMEKQTTAPGTDNQMRQGGCSTTRGSAIKKQSNLQESVNASPRVQTTSPNKEYQHRQHKLRKFLNLPRNQQILQDVTHLSRHDIEPILLGNRPVKLGQGSYGKVYLRGYNGKLVVEKRMIKRERESELTRAHYFLKELEAMKSVSHLPQFPTLVGIIDEFPYESIVMEYMADPCAPAPLTLHDVLKYPDLEKSQILKICSDIARGLQALHESGFIHCDIKTNNLLVRRIYKNGKPTRAIEGKIIDLGVAHKLSQPSLPRHFDVSEFDMNSKKYPYMAPEILRKKTGYTVQSDTFSLGYALSITGKIYQMPALEALGELCQSNAPSKRPTLRYVNEYLDAIHR